MGYCFMTMTKIKNMTGLMKRAEHNLREKEVLNADPEKKSFNDEIISLNGKDIISAWEERKSSLEYYDNFKLRKDAVKAIEIVMSVPKEDAEKINLETWKKANLKWLKDTFEKGPEGKGSNLLSVVYHGDESNSHIHAIITPVNEQGHFNANTWMGGRKQMIELQNSYAKEMKQFGLKRGLEGTKAKHKDIARMYAKIDQNLNSVEEELQLKNHESISEYHDRVVEYMKTRSVAQQRQLDDKDRKILEARHEMNEWKKRYDALGLDAELKENDMKRIEKNHEKEQEGMERQYGSTAVIRHKLEESQMLSDAISSYPDRERAAEISDGIRELLDWRRKQIREQEKQKERQRKADALENKLFGER